MTEALDQFSEQVECFVSHVRDLSATPNSMVHNFYINSNEQAHYIAQKIHELHSEQGIMLGEHLSTSIYQFLGMCRQPTEELKSLRLYSNLDFIIEGKRIMNQKFVVKITNGFVMLWACNTLGINACRLNKDEVKIVMDIVSKLDISKL